MSDSSQPPLEVVLVDINRAVTAAWKATFADEPGVRVVRGSITRQKTDAWVTPTNAAARMDGGVDAAVNRHFGGRIQDLVQAEVGRRFAGTMPVGSATCVPTGGVRPRFLISTPTMVGSNQDVSDTLNTALACAAAFQAIHRANAADPGAVLSVALPGLGAATGKVSPRACANLMWTAYSLFRDYVFPDDDALRAVVVAHLGGTAEAAHETERMRITLPKELGVGPYIVGGNGSW